MPRSLFSVFGIIANYGVPTTPQGQGYSAAPTTSGAFIVRRYNRNGVISCSDDSITLIHLGGEQGTLKPGNIFLYLGTEEGVEVAGEGGQQEEYSTTFGGEESALDSIDCTCSKTILARKILSSQVVAPHDDSITGSIFGNSRVMTVTYKTAFAKMTDIFPPEIAKSDSHAADLSIEPLLTDTNEIKDLKNKYSDDDFHIPQRKLGVPTPSPTGATESCQSASQITFWGLAMVLFPFLILLLPILFLFALFVPCLWPFVVVYLIVFFPIYVAGVVLYPCVLLPVGIILLSIGGVSASAGDCKEENFIAQQQAMMGNLPNGFGFNLNADSHDFDLNLNADTNDRKLWSTVTMKDIVSNYNSDHKNNIGLCLKSLSWEHALTGNSIGNTDNNVPFNLSPFLIQFDRDNDNKENSESGYNFANVLSATCKMCDDCYSNNSTMFEGVHVCEDYYLHGMMNEICSLTSRKGLLSPNDDNIVTFPLTTEFIYNDCHAFTLLLHIVGKIIGK